MAKIEGVGPIYIGENAVVHMGSWSLNGTNEVVEDYDLVDNSRQADYGSQSFSGEMSGVSALEDTTGQALIEAAFTGKTKILNIKYYLTHSTTATEKVVYWAPKSTSGGILITSFSNGKDGGSETSKCSFSWTCDGLMEKTVETLT